MDALHHRRSEAANAIFGEVRRTLARCDFVERFNSYCIGEVQQQLEAAGLHGLEFKELSDRYLEVVGTRH